MISPKNKKLTIEEQCYALGLPRSTYYYKPLEGDSDRNLEIMRIIAHQYAEHPAIGSRQVVDYLKSLGLVVGRKLVRRLMALMDIRAIYPMKSLSNGGWMKYRMPYLLRYLDITHPNHVWSTDISYVAVEHCFMYLHAIIDVYSRCIVGWGLYNTLDASNAIEVLVRAIQEHGAPEIINSDQGCQYTSKEWLETCETYGIKVSMDGGARCHDNIWIERFWRTIKREYIHLNPEDNVVALRRGIAGFIDYYNTRRSHQGIGHKIPAQVYAKAA